MTKVWAIDSPEGDAVYLSLDGEVFLGFSRDPKTEEDIEVIRSTFNSPDIEGNIRIVPSIARRALGALLGFDLSTMRTLEV